MHINNQHFRRSLLTLAALATAATAPEAGAAPFASQAKSLVAQGAPYTVKLPNSSQASPRVAFVVSLAPSDAKPGATVTLTVKTVIHSGWHISAVGSESSDSPSLPTNIEFEARGLAAIDESFVPSVKPSAVQIGEATHLQHSGTLSWQRKYRVLEKATTYSGTGSIGFQVCDKETCLPPTTLSFNLGTDAQEHLTATTLQGLADKSIGQPITIALKESKMERKLINRMELVTADPNKDWDEYVKQLMTSMKATQALPLGGTFEMNGSAVTLYIPDQESYSLVNTGRGDTNFENTSTYISIDYNGDGEIVDYESLATNLPVRLFDSMFVVTEVSKIEKRITLQQVDIPLAGAVLNRRCPDFSYQTVDGQIVSTESIRGKATILDVWAVT